MSFINLAHDEIKGCTDTPRGSLLCLPGEILLVIATLGLELEDDVRRARVLLSLTPVCQRLRCVCVAAPALWTALKFGHGGVGRAWASLAAARAQDQPLAVALGRALARFDVHPDII
jgi:hypothetical protein